MIRRADRRDLDVLAVLVQQLSEVGEPLRTLELVGIPLAFERIAIDVADGDDIAELRGIVRIAAPLPPTPMQATLNFSLGDWLSACRVPAATKKPVPAMVAVFRNVRRVVLGIVFTFQLLRMKRTPYQHTAIEGIDQ